MEVDSATSVIQNPVAKHLLPELEIYCYLLVLLFLIDQKRYDAVESYFCMFIFLPAMPIGCTIYAKVALIFHFRPNLVPQLALFG